MNLNDLYNQIFPKTAAFLGVFFVVMIAGYGILYLIDFVPEPKGEGTEESAEAYEEPSLVEETPPLIESTADPLPISITIERLGRTVTVLNPTSRTVADLDAALLKGVVRHPDSADLNDKNGNILILGHSSYLNNVLNKNFQAFNGIQNLTWGDVIRLKSGDTEYTYRVDRVYEEKASTVNVPVWASEPKLTLVTCNTFGAKEDRFIVEATLVSKKAL
ncbi:MAG: sortase [Candidatus Paceibacterota bacterium]